MGYTTSARFYTPCMKVNVLTRKVVSEESLKEVRGVTATEQHPMIDYGDTVSVVFFHNTSLDCTGTVTIWHNKHQAAVKTYSTSLAGEWLDSLKLIITEEREQGWTPSGELVTGSLAMDLNGVVGIYSCGQFYRSQDMA